MAQQQQQQAAQFNQTMSNAAGEIQQLRSQVQSQQLALQQQQSSPSPQPGTGLTMSGPPQPIRIDMKPLQPSSFTGSGNGSSNNADQWLVEMERYFSISGLSEADTRRVPLASTYLKDTASAWFTSASAELGVDPSWAQFKGAFLARFRPIAASRVARAALRVLKHRHKVAGYTQEFQRHMQAIHDMSVTDQIEQYLNGLQQHIAMEVDREQPTTLAAAMEAAHRVELLLSTRRGGQSYGPPRRGYNPFRGSDSHRQNTSDSGERMDLSVAKMESQDRRPSTDTAEEEEDDQLHALQSFRGRGGRGGSFRPSRGRMSGGGARNGPKLSPEELEKLYQENRCFNCREKGHSARFCDKQSKN